jgi:hypothetical protein
MLLVPALLQTEDYTAAIIRGISPKIDLVILRERVEATMRRQQLLEEPTLPRYRALLDEAVLYRQVGGTAVMRAQLGKILQLVQEGKATVQVIPFVVGSYAAMDSNFIYLEFGASTLPDIVFVESLGSQFYHERSTEIMCYAESLEYLQDTALSPRDSVSRIEDIRNGSASPY